MAGLSKEEEMLIVRNVHLVSDRIENNMPLSEDRLFFFKNLFSDLFSVLSRATPEEVFAIFEQHRDHPFFARDIETVLTPRGKEFLTGELKMIRENAEKESTSELKLVEKDNHIS